MSGVGNCYDNAAVEIFFKTIKAEMLWQQPWPTRRSTEIAIFKHINGFYNPRRRHLALGWRSPLAFEAQAAQMRTWGGTIPWQDHRGAIWHFSAHSGLSAPVNHRSSPYLLLPFAAPAKSDA